MLYFKYVPYLYLVAGAFFLYDALVRLHEGQPAYISLGFVGLAIFMFFFRKKYAGRFNNNHRQDK
ncbi:hypothetical protein CHU92_12005 [Flavobacterium cyanobacteriorum]|uniref:Uncharacterized protein n=1 Tax=Flavobacterium cyanobacteriorum TaxID=2022802 RepID=A0A255YYW5_9FLAO|nr:hypothetical protein [Flavobacterium cyanobacteriorum]OYQ34388.1 hypothetical protein CHU92_12005 [Flavobacterium cyanobacteriorum]